MVQWQHSKVALKGLDEIMALPCDHNPGESRIIPVHCEGELSLDGASFSYSSELQAVKPTKLVIRPGERIAILGPVGSGKSTLIKLLSGLYKPTEGRVFLDGVDMTHLAYDFVREHVGYLTQDVRLFSGTLKDNLTIGLPSPSDAQILAAANKTGLGRLVREHPAGLNLPIMEGGRGLSGGQRQLVGLTRMLIARPNVLLLDEPTASMDADLESHVMNNIFASISQNSVIVMATHKRALVNLVDRVIVMDRGQIVMDGKRDEVMHRLMNPPQARVSPNSNLPGAQA
jgi:ATP-binding cassette subfamily C protein LapB